MTISEKLRSLTSSLNKIDSDDTYAIDPKEVKQMLQKREAQLRTEFHKQMEKELEELKVKFDAILRNEQVRTSYMLTGAHRERKEKLKALKNQLECKNLAGLMYVMCNERKRSKVQQMKIVEVYTNYIKGLQEILKDSQEVILNLSRGYKTAARVDREWRAKVIAVINEFRAFVYNFMGGSPETNQYFFDIPKLLKIKAPTHDNPEEDPCCCEEEQEPEASNHDLKEWWERFDDDTRPFMIYGDMTNFTPPQKLKILNAAKKPKSAPKRWKEYNFNNMPILSECFNLNSIKDEYFDRIPLEKWECHLAESEPVMNNNNISLPSLLPSNYQNRRLTAASLDYKNMGSILKIITATTTQPHNKTMLLGARDSMEIASTTRLKRKSAMEHKVVVSAKAQEIREGLEQDSCICMSYPPIEPKVESTPIVPLDDSSEVLESLSSSKLGSVHHDSLQKISTHKPEKDRVINYEKECPMPECQLQVDSFIRALPEYMRASPFTHFQVDFDHYETCSPEQLNILKERIDARKRDRDSTYFESPLAEWMIDVGGVSCQTSETGLLPPCTCRQPAPTPMPSVCKIYDVKNLLPLKKALNDIKEKAFYDPTIQFDRFEIIGEPSDQNLTETNKDFKTERVQEVIRILRTHPSLRDLFQANHRC